MTIKNIDRLLNPKSVAVFGASDRVGSVGATVWRNLAAGFKGALYAVNPNRTEVDGRPVFASTAELPAAPDLAVICTPAHAVPGIVAMLGAKGTRAAIVVSAGLTREQKQAALDAARPYVMRLLGPNCIGLLTPHLGLNASFAHTDALAGDLAFVSQSGALVTAVLDWAKARSIGFSHMISLGEHCDVDFGDLLDHLATDPRTRSILLYIESIDAPRKFMSAARAAARNKPVIVVKAGRAGHGVKAAASHTGALAGADVVFDAAIRRAGMLRVDTLQQLFIAAATLARFRGQHLDRMTIMTNGGGAGVMAADAAALAGVTLAEPGGALLQRLDAFLPPNWSRANPIDLIGDAPVERYTETLSALLATHESGAVLFLHSPTAIVPSGDIARACVPIVRENSGRVMSCWLGEEAVADARRQFREAGVAGYRTPEDAVHAFAMLQTYRRNQETLLETPEASGNGAPDVEGARALVAAALAERREWLSETEAKAVLAAYGVPVVKTVAVGPTAAEAVTAAEAIGYPVVLKIVSPDITHKSDVGGVKLNLDHAKAVERAVAAMLATVSAKRPDARVAGFTVQQMARRPHAHEIIVGASVDPIFGPVLLCGHGGTAVEVTADRAVALPPLNRNLAREMVSRTRVSRLLAGYRDRPPARLDALYDVLIAVAQMQADLPALAELDINPLWVDEDGVLALDARIRLSNTPVAGAERFAIQPYPTQWVERVRWNGQDIVIRPIRPEDEALHREFIARLDPEDLRMRFFQVRRELAHSELARLTQIDYAREMAFVAVGTDADGKPQTLGVVRAVGDPDNTEAEFAIVVRSDLKNRGLGRLLLDRITRYAKARGTPQLVAYVLRENEAMLGLGRGGGFVRRASHPFDDDVVLMVKPV